MTLRKIGNNYYSYFRDEYGKQRTIAAKTSDRKEAEAFDRTIMETVRAKRQHMQVLKYADPELREKLIRQQEEQKIRRERENGKEHKRGTIRLDAMLDIAAKKQPDLSYTIQCAYKAFVRSCGEKGLNFADEITPSFVQSYLESKYAGEDKNNVSFNRVRGHLNRIFRLCLVEAGLSSSPVETVVCRKIRRDLQKHHGMISYADFDKAVSSITDLKDLFMLYSSRWTAQRLETCARFTLSMFDFERRVFIIQPGKTSRFTKFVCVPLFPEYIDFMQSRIIPAIKDKDPETPIVKHLGYTSNVVFSHHINRILKRLGIPATFHSLRSTAITWMKENGIPYEIRTDISGHSTKEIEDVYARAIANVSEVASRFKCM